MKANFNPARRGRTERDRCIVNCGITEHYRAGHLSTRAHCTQHCPDAWQLFYDGYPDGCPSHANMQYAFKIYALQAAIDAGFRYLLWMDCTFQPVDSIEPLWATVEREGWYIPPQWDAKLGNWCSDAALDIFGIDRTAALGIQLVYSGLVGLDVQSDIGSTIWNRWKALYEAGSFNGCHQNKPGLAREPWGQKWQGHVSHDPNVWGHRHDEAALSYVLYSLGLNPPRLGFLTYETPAGFIGHHVS